MQNILPQVMAFVTQGGPYGILGDDVLDALRLATDEFALAPDEFIDVRRLPPGVVNLTSLVDYLRTIRTALQNRDTKTKLADSDVAKSGQLRTYKMYVCAIYALSDFLDGQPDYTLAPAKFAETVILHGRANEPPGLAKNGKVLWEKSFADGNPRMISVVKSLLFFAKRHGQAVQALAGNNPAVGGGNSGTSGTNVVPTGSGNADPSQQKPVNPKKPAVDPQ